MKNLKLLAIVFIVYAFFWCDSCKKRKMSEFSGTVISNSGSPVAEAVVQINKERTLTGEDGTFTLPALAEKNGFLVSVRKFGFGLYSSRFDTGFRNKKIFLTEGTITEFDPSKDRMLTDSKHVKNPFKPALLSLDTAKLFKAVPLVYDGQGKLIDIGYPAGTEHTFDYLKMPVTGGPGITVGIAAGSLVDGSGNTPPAGTMLKAALSTVDFFNPDGMPGDFIVKTEKGLAYMESYGAGTIEISDGRGLYQLKKGTKARIIVPIYPIHLKLHQKLEEKIALLHFDEDAGVWVETGVGYLNSEKTAYEGEVTHLSVLNMDMVKTGPSKCFKVRQLLKQGATDNTAGYLSQYRAQIVVPQTSTSPFQESPLKTVDETTGCVPVNVSGLNNSTMHPITRIAMAVPNIVVVFSNSTTTDVLGISIGMTAPGDIPADMAVSMATNCATTCTAAAAPCNPATNDPLNTATAASSDCNINTGCFLSNCGFVPFENLTSQFKIVAIPMGSGKVRVKWISSYTSGSYKITVGSGACPGTSPAVADSSCVAGGCFGGCKSGQFDYTGTAGSTVSFTITVYTVDDCGSSGGFPTDSTCSNAVVVI